MQNRFEHSLRISEDVIVPEPKNAEAALFQICIAQLIALTVGMLSAVRFNDQHLFEADKVRNPWSERNLTAEFNI